MKINRSSINTYKLKESMQMQWKPKLIHSNGIYKNLGPRENWMCSHQLPQTHTSQSMGPSHVGQGMCQQVEGKVWGMCMEDAGRRQGANRVQVWCKLDGLAWQCLRLTILKKNKWHWKAQNVEWWMSNGKTRSQHADGQHHGRFVCACLHRCV